MEFIYNWFYLKQWIKKLASWVAWKEEEMCSLISKVVIGIVVVSDIEQIFSQWKYIDFHKIIYIQWITFLKFLADIFCMLTILKY